MEQGQIKKKVSKYIKEEEKLLKKHKLGRVPILLFPKDKMPLTGKIAMWVLRRHKADIDFQFFIKD